VRSFEKLIFSFFPLQISFKFHASLIYFSRSKLLHEFPLYLPFTFVVYRILDFDFGASSKIHLYRSHLTFPFFFPQSFRVSLRDLVLISVGVNPRFFSARQTVDFSILCPPSGGTFWSSHPGERQFSLPVLLLALAETFQSFSSKESNCSHYRLFFSPYLGLFFRFIYLLVKPHCPNLFLDLALPSLFQIGPSFFSPGVFFLCSTLLLVTLFSDFGCLAGLSPF